jgi:hypothetical protein
MLPETQSPAYQAIESRPSDLDVINYSCPLCKRVFIKRKRHPHPRADEKSYILQNQPLSDMVTTVAQDRQRSKDLVNEPAFPVYSPKLGVMHEHRVVRSASFED